MSIYNTYFCGNFSLASKINVYDLFILKLFIFIYYSTNIFKTISCFDTVSATVIYPVLSAVNL